MVIEVLQPVDSIAICSLATITDPDNLITWYYSVIVAVPYINMILASKDDIGGNHHSSSTNPLDHCGLGLATWLGLALPCHASLYL